MHTHIQLNTLTVLLCIPSGVVVSFRTPQRIGFKTSNALTTQSDTNTYTYEHTTNYTLAHTSIFE